MSAITKRKAVSSLVPDAKKTRPLTSFFSATPTASKSTSSVSANRSTTPSTLTAVSQQHSSSVTKPTNFDKDKWVASLTPEQKTLLQLEINTLHPSWLAALSSELTKPYFLSLKRFLVAEDAANQKVLPPARDVYAWSRLTPLDSVKVVILGQDPYHNFNQAHGLAFSVLAPTPPPPSLRNIFKCLALEYPDFKPPTENRGDLTKWAERGVMLLNTCLTVRAHSANSHAGKGWEQFTEKVIAIVAEKCKNGVVFLAWGSPAAKRVERIDRKVHCVLKSVHPSPLSASRGFFECQHFTKTNAWLSERYGKDEIIDWSL
ncbi:uracil-DNA glycosylase-like protein [Kockiozyma suomiensis]|uniref:uracil-DNA glycosylase-like protein n=1 Tax=Kockiozyma suomiensis TaxID=1337062 RepID=UPI0033433929